MDYLKISISTQPVREWFSDVLASELSEIGFESFEETESGIEAYIPEKNFDKLKFENIINRPFADVEIEWKPEVIKDRNWNEVWEKNYFKPLIIGSECVIRAPFHDEYPKARYEIIIEPNMAFGTGNHETTTMMMEAILAENVQGKKILDMGCGTGILGILASMKGAEKIVAVDISEWAFSGTKENAAYNNIKNLTVYQGDAGMLGDETFDLIFANIQKNVLIEDMPAYKTVLNPKGKLFLSGFYSQDLEDIKNAAGKLNLNYQSHDVRRNWVVAVFQS